jgi:hypothetical protein
LAGKFSADTFCTRSADFVSTDMTTADLQLASFLPVTDPNDAHFVPNLETHFPITARLEKWRKNNRVGSTNFSMAATRMAATRMTLSANDPIATAAFESTSSFSRIYLLERQDREFWSILRGLLEAFIDILRASRSCGSIFG